MSQHPESYNRRWRRRWRSQVARSTLIAALLHAAVVVLLPTWLIESRSSGRASASSASTGLALVHLADGSEELVAPLRPAAPAPAPETEDEPEDAPDPDDAPRPEDAPDAPNESDETSTSEQGLPDGTPGAPERADAPSAPDDPSVDGPTRITAGPRAAPALSDVADPDVATVRAVAVAAPLTGWIMVRNPSAIERYMRMIYSRGIVDREAVGSVSISLEIDENGAVARAEITDSSGQSEMDRIVLDLFEDVVAFRPARDRGTAVASSATFSLSFPWF